MSPKTTPQYLIYNAEKYPDEPAISSKLPDGQWDTSTWSQFRDYTVEVARALIGLGFEKNDKLSIYSYNRKEWYAAYAAANLCNGAAVGVYHTCSPEEVEWVVGNSDSKIVFVGHNPMDGGDPNKMCTNRLHEALSSLDK
ncbi:MAG: AMP-binding protein, partial [Candidatus Thalassarchaeaceae archaeon]|nr:AMP-binding protein [Candidatus Thalassarchaeaceae archaeon]